MQLIEETTILSCPNNKDGHLIAANCAIELLERLPGVSLERIEYEVVKDNYSGYNVDFTIGDSLNRLNFQFFSEMYGTMRININSIIPTSFHTVYSNTRAFGGNELNVTMLDKPDLKVLVFRFGSSVLSPIIFSRFNHGRMYSVCPIDKNGLGLEFHIKYFTKRDSNNNILLTPARLKKINNIYLVPEYPASCFYCSNTGLVNNNFYTFTDGDIGFYENNRLYK